MGTQSQLGQNPCHEIRNGISGATRKSGSSKPPTSHIAKPRCPDRLSTSFSSSGPNPLKNTAPRALLPHMLISTPTSTKSSTATHHGTVYSLAGQVRSTTTLLVGSGRSTRSCIETPTSYVQTCSTIRLSRPVSIPYHTSRSMRATNANGAILCRGTSHTTNLYVPLSTSLQG